MKTGDCCIINTLSSSEAHKMGHWVAIIIQDNEKFVFYDSFGRTAENLFNKPWKSSNPNREQEFVELNCGARCLGFLASCYIHGIETTIKYI